MNETMRKKYLIGTVMDIVVTYAIAVGINIILMERVFAYAVSEIYIYVPYALVMLIRESIGASISQKIGLIKYKSPFSLFQVAIKNIIVVMAIFIYLFIDIIFFSIMGITYTEKYPSEYIYIAYIKQILPVVMIILDSYYGWCLRLSKMQIQN
ncbi:hypothetical protein LLG95_01145 [bacterium]|nr:hypothetical protein [bacterium]